MEAFQSIFKFRKCFTETAETLRGFGQLAATQEKINRRDSGALAAYRALCNSPTGRSFMERPELQAR